MEMTYFMYTKRKVKFRQAGNCCKKVFEASKIAYANNKKSITCQRLGSRDFCGIVNRVLNKGQ